MLIEVQSSRSNKSGTRSSSATAKSLLIPTVVGALLMAVALAACSAGPQPQQRTPAAALLIHTGAVGQDNGSLRSNYPNPHRTTRQRNTLYAAAPRAGIPR